MTKVSYPIQSFMDLVALIHAHDRPIHHGFRYLSGNITITTTGSI